MVGHHELAGRFASILDKGWDISSSLFHGPASVGKRTAAFEISKNILCIGSHYIESCRCRSCIRALDDHPDFLCVGRTDRIKVADTDKVLSFISTAPFLSEKKVVVMDNVDTMTYEASNRLLKVLEEPPDTISFFLISSNPEGLIPTVRSRCVQFKFGTLSHDDCINIIWKKMGFDLPKARVLGWLACGSSADVFSNPGVYLTSRDKALSFMSTMKVKDPLDALDFVDRIGRSEMPAFIDMLILLLTDLMSVKDSGEVINADIRKDVEKVASDVDGKAFMIMAHHVGQTRKGQRYNVNMAMALKNAILKSHPAMSLRGAS